MTVVKLSSCENNGLKRMSINLNIKMESKGGIKRPQKNWHPQQQIILKNWAELGNSYRYLHDKAFNYYSKQSLRFALPVIIISTITGTANFAQDSFPESVSQYVPSVIGFFNLTAGLITTISQFLKVSELLEGHRVASAAFGKFSRNISIELLLPIKERSSSGTKFLMNCREELNRLLEQSPNIPSHISRAFTTKFKKKSFEKPSMLDVSAVEIYIDEENEQEELEKKLLQKKLERERIAKEENDKQQKLRDQIAGELIENRQKESMDLLNSLEIRKLEKVGTDSIAKNMQKLIKKLHTKTSNLEQDLDSSSQSSSSEDSPVKKRNSITLKKTLIPRPSFGSSIVMDLEEKEETKETKDDSQV